MPEPNAKRRTIAVHAELSERPPLRSKTPADYPDVPRAYLEIAQHYAHPLLFGPPLCDELVALVEHLFTEEEADLVRHIRSPLGKTIRQLAAASARGEPDVRHTLHRLMRDRPALLVHGRRRRRRYGLIPIVPGVFESVMVRTSLESLTPWHRRFAELFTALYDTGYLADYAQHRTGAIRYLPARASIAAHPRALPSDRLDAVLRRYDVFAVGLCQCRVSERLAGRGCDAPIENCVTFGEIAAALVRDGRMRAITRADVLRIKADAEHAGLATFVAEAEFGGHRSGASCSCCGCCCGVLRTVTEFGAHGFVAPPHFMPRLDAARCVVCARCVEACPVGALELDRATRTIRHHPQPCIGCGLCAAACAETGALRMEPVRGYRRPARNLLAQLLRRAPNALRNVWHARQRRRAQRG